MQGLRQIWSRLHDAAARFASVVPADSRSECEPARLIVGLGNPGERYARTRHNVGFRVVDLLGMRHAGVWRSDHALQAETCRVEIGGRVCLLVRPQTFMNRSGSAVLAACEQWPSLDPRADLLIVYDDLDLPVGRIRLRPGGGGGGHRGISDILLELGRRDIPRLRFGIGHPGSAGAVVDWVLTPFSAEQEQAELPAALERAADAVEVSVAEGLTRSMGQFNASG
ncbi:MAG: aminoacyl-tRNA hydrolase [Deltaproteobacteria bacterium]|nr:aminoacyl-tRNA hydrolase [Deltaproteobacteria bacterium]